MLKKYSFPILFAVVLAIASFAFVDNTQAAAIDVFLTCPSSNAPINTEFCATTPSPGQRYINNACRTFTSVEGIINSCTPAAHKVYSCTSNSCVCESGYCLNGSVCQTAVGTAACDAQDRVTSNTCTGACGGCKSGFDDMDPGSGYDCVALCDSGYERGTDGACYPIDEFNLFERLANVIYGVNLLTAPTYNEKETIFNEIISKIVTNSAYYFLTPTNATGTEYKYGSGGDPADTIRLESDWADSAWDAENAEYLNWDNYPGYESLLDSLLATVACDNDGNWEPENGEQCDDGSGGIDSTPDTGDCQECIWHGTDPVCGNSIVEHGEQCDDGGNDDGDGCSSNCFIELDLTSFPLSNLDTDGAGEDQVITNIGGVATWQDAAAGSTYTPVVFVGVSADAPNGSLGGYKNANDTYCDVVGPLSGSHVCTMNELIYSYETQVSGTGVYDPLITGNAWINNGPPGYTLNIVNDCYGWTIADSNIFGSIWKFDGDYSMVTPCSMSLKFACCK